MLNKLGHSVVTIYNVSMELSKLIMGILQYQPASDKTFLFKASLIMEITVKKTTFNM